MSASVEPFDDESAPQKGENEIAAVMSRVSLVFHDVDLEDKYRVRLELVYKKKLVPLTLFSAILLASLCGDKLLNSPFVLSNLEIGMSGGAIATILCLDMLVAFGVLSMRSKLIQLGMYLFVFLFGATVPLVIENFSASYTFGALILISTLQPSVQVLRFGRAILLPVVGVAGFVCGAALSSHTETPIFKPSYVVILVLCIFNGPHDLYKGERALRVAFYQKSQLVAARKASKRASAEIIELNASIAEARGIVDNIVNTEANSDLIEMWSLKFAWLKFQNVNLGEGAYGSVVLATYKDENVAVKRIRVSKVSQTVIMDFLAELKIMSPLQHPGILALKGGCWKDGPDKLCLVTEYCPYGSLDDMLRRTAGVDDLVITEFSKDNFTWTSHYHSTLVDVARAMKYLHCDLPGAPLLHRDLKPANVLIGANQQAKVGDFGEARRFDPKVETIDESDLQNSLEMTVVGTPLYCSPEVAVGDAYNLKADVYSFGMCLMQVVCVCCTGKYDFVIKQFNGSFFRSCSGWRPIPPRSLYERDPRVWKIISRMMSHETDERPNFQTICDELASMEKLTSALKKSCLPEVEEPSVQTTSVRQNHDQVAIENFAKYKALEESQWEKLKTNLEGPRFKDLEAQPCHIKGPIALLRFLTNDKEQDPLAAIQKTCEHRAKHRSGAKFRAIMLKGYTLGSLPGTAEVHAATYSCNDWVCCDRTGDVVVYERWGSSVDPVKMVKLLPKAKFEEWCAWRVEARAILLNVLSRKSRRLIEYKCVVDLGGVSQKHQRVLPYVDLYTNGPIHCAPPIWRATYIVGTGFVAKALLKSAFALFLKPIHAKRIVLTSRVTDTQFSTTFALPLLPADIGGRLNIGTMGDCCSGVRQPCIRNDEAILVRYESFNARVTACTAGKHDLGPSMQPEEVADAPRIWKSKPI